MGIFLNNGFAYADYRESVQEPYFVDKSMLIKELIAALGRKNRYLCITRPRRFGKSVMASMVGAFFGKAVDSSDLFDTLAIANHPDYGVHLNKHHVIYIDFSRIPEGCDSYPAYMDRILISLKADLTDEYPDLGLDLSQAVWDTLRFVFEKTGQRFIFVMDEWDTIFHKSYARNEDKEKYLEFMLNLLKDQPYPLDENSNLLKIQLSRCLAHAHHF